MPTNAIAADHMRIDNPILRRRFFRRLPTMKPAKKAFTSRHTPVVRVAGQINKRLLLKSALLHSGGLRLLESVPTWNGLLVLNYHRIGTPGESLFDHALWSADQDDFDSQVRMLKNHFDVIGLDDLPDVVRELNGHSRLSKKSSRFAMISFDDGYRDNFDLAFPVLRTHEVPGVFFITSGFLDERRLAWWDEISWMIHSSNRSTMCLPSEWFSESIELPLHDHAAALGRILSRYYELAGNQTERFINWIAEETGSGRAPSSLSRDLWMNWDMVREMQESGMGIGAHTVTHPILSNTTDEDQQFEVCESRLRIEQEIGAAVTAFSYPVGRRDAFNAATRRALAHHSFDWAFSYYGGFVRRGNIDRFDIPRVAVESDVTIDDFRACCALPQIFARH